MWSRRVSFSVALDWPKTAAQGKLFTHAIEAQFLDTKEKKLGHPSPGLSLVVRSNSMVGNKELPRIWRRAVRYLMNARVLSAHCDPWCYGMRVLEIPEDEQPVVSFVITEE